MTDGTIGNAMGPLSTACPFLAYGSDHAHRGTAPTADHRCFAENPARPIHEGHQARYCLTAEFGACPVFRSWAAAAAASVSAAPTGTDADAASAAAAGLEPIGSAPDASATPSTPTPPTRPEHLPDFLASSEGGAGRRLPEASPAVVLVPPPVSASTAVTDRIPGAERHRTPATEPVRLEPVQAGDSGGPLLASGARRRRSSRTLLIAGGALVLAALVAFLAPSLFLGGGRGGTGAGASSSPSGAASSASPATSGDASAGASGQSAEPSGPGSSGTPAGSTSSPEASGASAVPSVSGAPSTAVRTPRSYAVQSGDTFCVIARRFRVTGNELLAANPQLTDPNVLEVGAELTIPIRQGRPGSTVLPSPSLSVSC